MYKQVTLGKRMIIALLTVCLILVGAVPTFAASRITLKSGTAAPKKIYVGNSYTLTVKGVNVKFYSSNKSVATIGEKNGKLNPIAPGTVKITAKNAKTDKVVDTHTFTVLQRAESVTAEVSELYLNVGDTATIKATKTPDTSTDVIRFASSDKTIATVGTTSGKVTAVKNGKCTINVYSKATTAIANSNKNNKVTTVEVFVGPYISQVIQKSVTELDVVFQASAPAISPNDLVITNDTTKETYPVKSVSTDKTNNKIVHVKLFTELKDGKTYTVSYDQISAQFTATEGQIANLQIVPTQIHCGSEESIYVQLLDANGIILGSYTRSDAPDNITFDKFEVKNGGWAGGDKICFDQKDGTGVVKAVYHTYKYENGEEVGTIEREQTITAIEAPTTLNIDYTLNYGERPNFKATSYKQNTTAYWNEEAAVHFFLTDYKGEEIQDYSKYQVVSADTSKVQIRGKLDNADKKVLMKPFGKDSVGTIYIKVLDAKGNLIEALPVTIKEAPVLTTIGLSSYASTLYKGQFGDVIDVIGKNQYGEDFSLCGAEYFNKIKIEMKNAPQGAKIMPKIELIKTADKRVQIKVDVPSSEVVEGTYQYVFKGLNDKQLDFTLSVKDASKLANNFLLMNSSPEIDLTHDQEEVNEPIILYGELCTNKTLKFSVESTNENSNYPIPKIIQDEQGNYLLNLDLSGEMVTAGNYSYQIKCSYESKGKSILLQQKVVIKVKGEKPSKEQTIDPSGQPGVSLMAEGHGEVKADLAEIPEGIKVTLMAFPESGYRLKEWKIIEGSAEIVDNSFVLKSGSVTIKGIFERMSTEPTTEPSTIPTASPSTEPTVEPSTIPTASPSTEPTVEPSTMPTASPSTIPTAMPSTEPTVEPSTMPTTVPSTEPTAMPSTMPTASPSTSSSPSSQNDSIILMPQTGVTKLEDIKMLVNKEGKVTMVGGSSQMLSLSLGNDQNNAGMAFNEPLVVTIDLSKVSIQDSNKLTLVKYEEEEHSTHVKKLGGTYDKTTGKFSAYITEQGLFGIVEVDDLVKVSLQIGNTTSTLNEKAITNDVAPQIINGTTVVPLRFIAESLGAQVKWHAEEKKVVIISGDKTIEVGKEDGMIIKDSRTLVPVRYISESFGANVLWIPSTKRIEIVK